MDDIIRSNYNLLKTYVNEGVAKYGGRVPLEAKPPGRVFLPRVVFGKGLQHRAVAVPLVRGLQIVDAPPPMQICAELLKTQHAKTVLDIGCADGYLRTYLELEGISLKYSGMDVDTSLEVDFTLYGSLGQIHDSYDFVAMIEVAEHMPYQTFFGEYLVPIRERLLARDGYFVVSVPNPMNPQSHFIEMTHVQHYPWHKMYGLLRMKFSQVHVIRTHYLTHVERFFWLLPRIVMSRPLEHDWCEGLVFICQGINRL